MSRRDWKRPADGRSGTHTTIYLPSALLQRLRRQGKRINVSRVAADALAFEVARLEDVDAAFAAHDEWLAEH
jgi:post-segregation antitoxin (ccd killing protein)